MWIRCLLLLCEQCFQNQIGCIPVWLCAFELEGILLTFFLCANNLCVSVVFGKKLVFFCMYIEIYEVIHIVVRNQDYKAF